MPLDLWWLVRGLGKPHFPQPATHLTLDGKVGNHRLFAHLDLPQPRTCEFSDLKQAAQVWQGSLGLDPSTARTAR